MALRFIVVLLLFGLASATAQAQEKRALVIGNAAYRIGALKNPSNDARVMSQTLRQLGFSVREVSDRNLNQMDQEIRQFGNSIKPGSVAVIYFAGHGMQYRGENYLIPIGINAQYQDQLPRQAISTGFLMDNLSSNRNGLNIVILDACRDNPLQQRYRSSTRGLARIDLTPPNTFTLLSTGPNQVAFDNPRENNGLFTKYLVQQMKRPGIDLPNMVLETRKNVMAASGNKQIPYSTDSLTMRFCFAGCDNNAQVNTTVATAPVSTRVRPTQLAPNRPSNSTHRHGSRSHSHVLPAAGLNHEHGNGVTANTGAAAVVNTPSPARPTKDPREPEMVFIKGGIFTMGSPANEAGRESNERQHSVSVGNFYLGKTEITNAEYARCVSAGACKAPEWQERGSKYNLQTGTSKHYQGFTSPQQPVVGVSWHNAQSYAQWLSKLTRKRYSLPTEAQWEYAARAGTQTAYSWGNAVSRSHANYGAEACCDGKAAGADRWIKTAPVGSFPANRFGLRDMLGNVWEWTCSAYDRYYDGPEQRCAPNNDARQRVLRGGSWFYSPGNVRSAFRFSNPATNQNGDIGFRLSRTP